MSFSNGKYFNMIMNDIQRLAQNRPLQTPEIYEPNDFYGHATILKEYMNLPNTYQIKAAIEHGAGIGGNIWEKDIDNRLPAIFTSSRYRAEILKEHTNKKIFMIGPKIKYADHILDQKAIKNEQKRLGNNMLAFPAHSTHHIDVHYDIRQYCKHLQNLGKNFDKIRVCLYWKDILRGFDKEYNRFGFEVITAGHMFDPLFLPRLKSIIETATFTTSNMLGTILGYCVISNKPHLLVESEVEMTSESMNKLLECTNFTNQSDVMEIRQNFKKLDDQITPKQNEIVNKYWGVSEFKSKDEIKIIIDECENIYQKTTRTYISQNNQQNCEYLFEGDFDKVLTDISKIINTYPRRKNGKLRINHKEIGFADLHSFYHQSLQIFKSQIYGCSVDKENPIIVDCGAHIGLASIYFAEKYPKGKIYAYEADPNIAKILNKNLSSLGVKNVEAFSHAVWIDDDGVLFESTNDDSGFISNSELNSCVRIPSIRLKDFLKDKKIDLLKLDIEGSEFDVIKDCEDVLINVRNIIIEAHKFRDHNSSLAGILNVLEKNNFEYTLGDLHLAKWLEPSLIPPFSACSTNKYTITIFAWQPENKRPDRVETHNHVENAINELNSGQNSKAIHFIKKALQEAPEEKSLYYPLSVAYARENNFFEAHKLLAQIPEDNFIFSKASLLREAIDAQISGLVYLASYPRSGNTWMRFLLADIMLQLMGYHTDTKLPFPVEALIPDMHLPGKKDIEIKPPVNLIKTHNEYNDQQKKSLYVFRNPADSLISYYYFHLRYPERKGMVSDGANTFCIRTIDEWCRHIISYIKAKEKMDKSIFFVSYENMHNGLSSILKRVLNFIDLPFDVDIVDRAVNNHTFKKHQADEKLGEKFLNKFFRKGQCGYGEHELSENVVEIIHRKAEPLYRQAKKIEERQTNPSGE